MVFTLGLGEEMDDPKLADPLHVASCLEHCAHRSEGDLLRLPDNQPKSRTEQLEERNS